MHQIQHDSFLLKTGITHYRQKNTSHGADCQDINMLLFKFTSAWILYVSFDEKLYIVCPCVHVCVSLTRQRLTLLLLRLPLTVGIEGAAPAVG